MEWFPADNLARVLVSRQGGPVAAGGEIDIHNQPTLLPKEHGAYAELAFPLVTGLAAAPPSFPALALASAAVAFFLANEPIAVLLGARGQRLKKQVGPRARRRGFLLMGTGIALGGGGIVGAGASIWPALLCPLLSAALLIPMVLARRHKSVSGELLVVTAFSTFVLPLAAASGVAPIRMIPAAAVWWMSFALGTLEVHAIKARHRTRGRSDWTRWGSPLASGLAVAICLGALWRGPFGIPGATGLSVTGAGSGGDGALLALAPSARALLAPAAALLVLSLIRVHPRHLKRVGWTLVAANSLALIILLRV
ncbi:MAG: YwiC-like family protein [Gemmatimonadota bacterium]